MLAPWLTREIGSDQILHTSSRSVNLSIENSKKTFMETGGSSKVFLIQRQNKKHNFRRQVSQGLCHQAAGTLRQHNNAPCQCQRHRHKGKLDPNVIICTNIYKQFLVQVRELDDYTTYIGQLAHIMENEAGEKHQSCNFKGDVSKRGGRLTCGKEYLFQVFLSTKR